MLGVVVMERFTALAVLLNSIVSPGFAEANINKW
jgi:hypothetical protein